MCVAVVLNPGAELTADEIFKMGNANGDGFGIAWAEDGVVNWWKTLVYDVDYLTYTVAHLKDFTRFVHFRLTTVGGTKLELCHPFEVGPGAACQQSGHANKVMMHNGHWYRAGELYDILKKEGALPDNGPWSDTRLAAFLASWDEDWLTTVTGKVATLDGNGNVKLIGAGWENLREGIKVSNKGWDHDYNYKRTGSGRRWEGWGWTDQHWKAKEEHDRVKKEQENEKESSSKKGEKGESKAENDNGAKRRDVVLGPKDGQLLATGRGSRADGPGETGRQNEAQEGGSKKYDLTPWHNPATGEWWQVDPSRQDGNRYALRKLTEDEARKALESIAAASSKVESDGA